MICFVQLKKALLGHCRYVCVHILTSGSCLTGPVVAPWPMLGPPLLKSPEEGTRPRVSLHHRLPQPLVIVCGPPCTHLSLQPAQVFLTGSHRHQILPCALLQPTASLCHCEGQKTLTITNTHYRQLHTTTTQCTPQALTHKCTLLFTIQINNTSAYDQAARNNSTHIHTRTEYRYTDDKLHLHTTNTPCNLRLSTDHSFNNCVIVLTQMRLEGDGFVLY